MTNYHYAVINAAVVREICKVPAPADCYISEDLNSVALRDLIDKGYRWIRTDGDWAIFEKPVYVSPLTPKGGLR